MIEKFQGGADKKAETAPAMPGAGAPGDPEAMERLHNEARAAVRRGEASPTLDFTIFQGGAPEAKAFLDGMENMDETDLKRVREKLDAVAPHIIELQKKVASAGEFGGSEATGMLINALIDVLSIVNAKRGLLAPVEFVVKGKEAQWQRGELADITHFYDLILNKLNSLQSQKRETA